MNELRFDQETLSFALITKPVMECRGCKPPAEAISSAWLGDKETKIYEIRDDLQPSKYQLDGVFNKSSEAHGYQELLVENTEHGDRFKEYSIEDLTILLEILRDRVEEIEKHNIGENIILTRYTGGHGMTLLSVLPVPKIESTACMECKETTTAENREITSTENFISVIPFAPKFNSEIRIIPKKHLSFDALDSVLTFDLAGLIKKCVSLDKQEKTIIIRQLSNRHMIVDIVNGEITPYQELGISRIDGSPEETAKEFSSRMQV